MLRPQLAAPLAMAFLLAASAAFAQTLSDEERREGFRSMFNGKDLTGWRLGESSALPDKPSDLWKVEEGVIKLSGASGPNLASQWDYEDFEMRFEWRALRDKYNSGYFIRSGRKVGSNQINLAKGGEGRFFGGKMNGGKQVPELQKPAGEWNEWRTRIVGDMVTFWCNGTLAWEGTEFETKRGYIGLQTEGAPLEFRNLRIQELGFRPLEDDAWKKLDVGSGSKQSVDSFVDFVLRLEYLAKQGESAQLALRGSSEDGPVIRLGDIAEGSGGSPEIDLKPAKKADVPLGQWNYLEVRLADTKLSLWLNGVVVVGDFETKKTDASKSAPLALLFAEKPLQIQNVRVRPTKTQN